MAAKPSHDTLIHCEACGEDYSATYRRCPFCGARNDPRRTSGRDDPKSSSRYIPTPPPAKPSPRRDSQEELDDTYVFDGQDAFDEELEEEYYAPRPKGGKRLAPKEGGFELPPVNWPRLITFLCSLVIIVAALVIVFTFIYPQLHKDPDGKPSVPAAVSAAPSPVPGSSAPAIPSSDPVVSPDLEQPSAPVEPTVPPSAPVTTPPPTDGQRATVVNASGGLRVRPDPSTSNPPIATLLNGNSISVLSSAGNGWYNISFTGSGGQTLTGYIMGDYISTIAGSGTTATPPPSTLAPTTGGPTVGRAGTIVGASGGLNVRADPSTSNPPIATLLNGNTVQVVADAGNGWYQITFSGQGGVATPGYIKGEYISSN